MKKFIQLQNTYKTKKGDIWINHSPKDSDIYVHHDTQLLETEQTLLENPDWFQLVQEKLDLRSPEAEKMREEARSKRWEFIPTEGYPYWSYDILSKTVYDAEAGHLTGYYIYWYIGNCHRTKEEALAWGEKYARYFLTE